MSSSRTNKVFFEVMWFDDESQETPIIRGTSVDDLVETLLDLTKGRSGSIEIYKIEYNHLGYKIGLLKKLDVVNKIELTYN
ncbi:MAG: hypothetical protein ACFFBP_08810 [Promethearchaeota archaeon]